MRSLLSALLVIVLMISLNGCSRKSTPEKYGIYIVDGGKISDVTQRVHVVKGNDFHILLYHNEIKPSNIILVQLGLRVSSREFTIAGAQMLDVIPDKDVANLYKLQPKQPIVNLNTKYFAIYVGDPQQLSRKSLSQLSSFCILETNSGDAEKLAKVELGFLVGDIAESSRIALELAKTTNDEDKLGKLALLIGMNKYLTTTVVNTAWVERTRNWNYAFSYIFTEDGKKAMERYWGYIIDLQDNSIDPSLSDLLMRGDQRARLEIEDEIEKSKARIDTSYTLVDGVIWKMANGKPSEQLTSLLSGGVTSFDLSPDGKKILFTDDYKSIRILDLTTVTSKDLVIAELAKYSSVR